MVTEFVLKQVAHGQPKVAVYVPFDATGIIWQRIVRSVADAYSLKPKTVLEHSCRVTRHAMMAQAVLIQAVLRLSTDKKQGRIFLRRQGFPDLWVRTRLKIEIAGMDAAKLAAIIGID